jgi:uncharacterized membrane protein YeaQ/YmgE (transglycosylase-associated protein family)
MMTGFEVMLAWVGIGLAASIAAMVWPMRRGVLGVVINGVVGVAGAVSLGLLGHFLHLYGRYTSAQSFFFAAVGAILALTIAHVGFWRGPSGHARGGH